MKEWNNVWWKKVRMKVVNIKEGDWDEECGSG